MAATPGEHVKAGSTETQQEHFCVLHPTEKLYSKVQMREGGGGVKQKQRDGKGEELQETCI